MELKTVGTYNTPQLGDFLGISENRIAALSQRCIKHYIIYLKDAMSQDPEDARLENILIEAVVREAETFEEAIYLASALHITFSNLLQQQIDKLKLEKEKNELQ